MRTLAEARTYRLPYLRCHADGSLTFLRLSDLEVLRRVRTVVAGELAGYPDADVRKAMRHLEGANQARLPFGPQGVA